MSAMASNKSHKMMSVFDEMNLLFAMIDQYHQNKGADRALLLSWFDGARCSKLLALLICLLPIL